MKFLWTAVFILSASNSCFSMDEVDKPLSPPSTLGQKMEDSQPVSEPHLIPDNTVVSEIPIDSQKMPSTLDEDKHESVHSDTDSAIIDIPDRDDIPSPEILPPSANEIISEEEGNMTDDSEEDTLAWLDTCNENCQIRTRCCCGVCSGFINIARLSIISGKLALTTLATVGEFDPTIKRNLGIATVAVNGAALAVSKIYDYSIERTIKAQKKLAELEANKKQLTKSIKTTKKSLKQRKHPHTFMARSSLVDHIDESSSSTNSDILYNPAITSLESKLEQVNKRHDKLTNLTRFEKGWYKFAGICWPYAGNVFATLEIISTAAEMIVIPLATLASFDESTQTALNITAISLSACSTAFAFLKSKAQEEALERSRNFVDKLEDAGNIV